MIEVVFGQSAKGSLTLAQSCGTDRYLGGAVGIILDREEEKKLTTQEIKELQAREEEKIRLAWKKAIPLGGDRRDIFCFSLGFSMGDISDNLLSRERTEKLLELFKNYKKDIEYIKKTQEEIPQKFEELLKRAEHGEKIRIWYSEQPEEYCGMCWFISELDARMKKLPPISTINLPHRLKKDNIIVEHLGWGDVDPVDFSSLLYLEEEATLPFIKSAVAKWHELRNQNTNLRAVINGNLYSVPDDFYDFFIERELEKMPDEFNEAILIGNTLGRCQLAVSDMLIAIRIDEMIKKGRLKLISEAEDEGYRKFLRKSKSGI